MNKIYKRYTDIQKTTEKVQKKYTRQIKGFTLSQAVIAMIFIGIMAVLIIPDSVYALREKQRVIAYSIAWERILTSIDSGIIEYQNKFYADRQEERIAEDFQFNIHEEFENKYVYCKGEKRQEFAEKLWKEINDGVQAQGYSCAYPEDSILVKSDKLKTKAIWQGKSIGTGSGLNKYTCSSNGNWSPWIITETSLSYTINNLLSKGTKECETIEVINQQTSIKDAIEKSCAIILVDTNGLNVGPNKFIDEKAEINSGTNILELFQKDRLRIYVGIDGITTGSKEFTETGRIKIKCPDGYYSTSGNGCIVCEKGNECKEGGKSECVGDDKYSLEGAKECSKCSDKVEHCIKCYDNRNSECEKCESGYDVSIKGDVCCPEQTGCASYLTKCLCRSCKAGFIKRDKNEVTSNGENYICCPKVGNCIAYGTSCGKCTKCQGQYWYPSGSSCYYSPPF